MPLDTDFNSLVEKNSGGSGSSQREETLPSLIMRIHAIPKQIADSCQAVGVNERTMKNGMMSGVILPSQIAHDRWLSIRDGLIDAFFLFFISLVFATLGVGICSIVVFFTTLLYFYFHINWWEHGQQWVFIDTIKEYINKTRNFYYGVFVLSYFLMTTLGYHYSIKFEIPSKIKIVEKYWNLLISNLDTMIFSTNKETSEVHSFLSNVPKESEFSNANSYPITIEMDKSVLSVVDLGEKITVIANVTTEPNHLIFFISTVLFSLVLYVFYYNASKEYSIIKGAHKSEVKNELRTDLEKKMDLLKQKS